MGSTTAISGGVSKNNCKILLLLDNCPAHPDLNAMISDQESINISTCSNQRLRTIKKSEVLRSIQNLKFKKAPGYDLINPKVLKELPDVAFRFLTYVFNAILRTSTFPRQWKVAEIHIILKPGELPKSYRPISLLPKTYEQVHKVFSIARKAFVDGNF